ncbi:indolepyruvate ferredoxin oxidoreductase subunit alpha [Blastochloris sulfoviridis]|uniref:Indolepyruvate oxidoreductase subunit IorA n=1 Tax=Blastochloris sulfoviridis TaxID=50712 RepID=A0A5M6I3A3_9HYPH|nr:indolepyruvate ferredoxin oxidoreductase subunit alpha [Blastochloris sulfoviridis]KAA5602278.1 indolepyruvate ferredoxin oxidoreductase subunit alpha [Blastochloris sulfoviridis]
MNLQVRDVEVEAAGTESLPLMGNEAIARGAWEAGVRVAAAYPGTPSTEILESLAGYPASDLYADWSTNEKVALDVAIGAALSGVRAICTMKHVGLNVAADSLMSQSYIGVHGGLVLIVCDDPGIHSSQNEQDTRLFAKLAGVPVLEPSDAQEAYDFTKLAFELSEAFDTPVIVRSTTRLSHTRSLVRVGSRKVPAPKGFVDQPTKTVTIPANARRLHPKVIEREARLAKFLEDSPLTRWEKGDTRFGIVTGATSYLYVKEVAPTASILKLGTAYPLPDETIKAFAASVDRLIVVEELEPVLEKEIRGLGLAAEGKAFFPRIGEFSPELVRAGLAKAGLMDPAPAPLSLDIEPMARPPVLCSGCPHTATFLALRGLSARVAGDIGCYTLAAVEPLRSIDTTVCMGASIANATGMSLSGTETKPIVATIGDSTFLHSGIPPLIDAVYHKANITVVILDNGITAMTGGQDHPGTGRTLRGEPAPRVDYEKLCRAVGVESVRIVDPYEVGRLYQSLREAISTKGVSVVIARRPCVLDPVKIKGTALAVNAAGCVACQSCMNLGCPSITWSDEVHEGRHKVKIDPASCIGCTVCAQVCPSDCIQPVH